MMTALFQFDRKLQTKLAHQGQGQLGKTPHLHAGQLEVIPFSYVLLILSLSLAQNSDFCRFLNKVPPIGYSPSLTTFIGELNNQNLVLLSGYLGYINTTFVTIAMFVDTSIRTLLFSIIFTFTLHYSHTDGQNDMTRTLQLKLHYVILHC